MVFTNKLIKLTWTLNICDKLRKSKNFNLSVTQIMKLILDVVYLEPNTTFLDSTSHPHLQTSSVYRLS